MQDIHKIASKNVNNLSRTSGISCEAFGGMFLLRFIDWLKFGNHASPHNMARILSDKEIKKLIGQVVIGADENLVSPNGIELRLGTKVRFMSTNETKNIPVGHFVNVHPGEAVIIASIESLNLTREAVGKFFPGCSLMAMITPTTTMMREGLVQCATKVHAGFSGGLNWGFRNNSSKDFIMQQGEPMFNLTFFLLEGHEVPEVEYGKHASDKYQNTSGIVISQRKIPADIPKDEMVTSSFHKLDPKIQLREAGHPFNFIGTELTQLEGKFELVSSDVKALEKKIDDVMSALQLKSLTSTTAAIVMLMGLVLTVVTNDSALKILKNHGPWIGIVLFCGAAAFLFVALKKPRK